MIVQVFNLCHLIVHMHKNRASNHVTHEDFSKQKSSSKHT